jgi:two-component system chemotaxis response regulator CheY
MKILIVDDSEFIRLQLKKILEPEGHFVLEAKNGEDALKSFDNNSPDLVILDLMMPGIGGIEVLQEIINKKPDANIIICSSLASHDEYLKKVNEIGAIGVILKPFNKEDVLNSLQLVKV